MRVIEGSGTLMTGGTLKNRKQMVANVIQRAQQTGFTLDEIKELFFGFEPGTPPSKRWQEMSQRKLAELEALIDQMKTMQRLLERIQNCRCDALDECGKRLLAQVGAKDLLANATLLNQLSKQKTHRQE